MPVYTTFEYGGFTSEDSFGNFRQVPHGAFTALWDFIDRTKVSFFSLARRRGVKVITARNEVGCVTLPNGTSFEILPKIARMRPGKNPEGKSEQTPEEKARKIFLTMLQALGGFDFKHLETSNLDVRRFSLLEIFIKMFLDAVALLVKNGLRASYVSIDENIPYYKGKLLFKEHLKDNMITRNKFVVRHDEFSIDIPENRLIKTTLDFLSKITCTFQNMRNILRLQAYFDAVQHSHNIADDFSQCRNDRNVQHYRDVLRLCQIFLRGKGLTPFAGAENAFALFFSMERIFECFVAKQLRHHLHENLHVQTTRYHMFNAPLSFSLRPDMFHEDGGTVIILDTKWVLLDKESCNYGVTQQNMYQMYTYAHHYGAKDVILVFPKPDFNVNDDICWKRVTELGSHEFRVRVFFFDLQDIRCSTETLANWVRTPSVAAF